MLYNKSDILYNKSDQRTGNYKERRQRGKDRAGVDRKGKKGESLVLLEANIFFIVQTEE